MKKKVVEKWYIYNKIFSHKHYKEEKLIMISAGDFKNGITIEIDGNVCQIVEFQHVKPGKGCCFRKNKIQKLLLQEQFLRNLSVLQRNSLLHVLSV